MTIPGPLPHGHGRNRSAFYSWGMASAPHSETHEAPDAETDDDTITDGDCANLSHQFLTWLKDGITSGRLVLNARNARVHVTTEGLLLVSPAIFKDFSAHRAETQKRFQKRKLHKKTEEGTNIWMFSVIRAQAQHTINGLLIPDPKRIGVGVESPEPNPHLSLIMHNPNEKTDEPAPDAG